jgi:predicted phage terminase large subunit-like protein
MATGRLYLIRAQAGRYRPDAMGDKMVAFLECVYRMVGKRPEAVIVEMAAGGFWVQDRYSSTLPIIPVTPKGSKIERAGAVSWVINQGKVSLPDVDSSPWLKDWESEVGGFPLQSKNDQPDALTHSLGYALRPSEFQQGQRQPEGEIVSYDALEGSQSSIDSDGDEFYSLCDEREKGRF